MEILAYPIVAAQMYRQSPVCCGTVRSRLVYEIERLRATRMIESDDAQTAYLVFLLRWNMSVKS